MPKMVFYTQTYNNSATIESTVQSVLAQTMTDFVYYIADDCSTDNTVDILQQLALRDNRIRVIARTENSYMRTHRYALQTILEEHPEALYFAQLDGDDWYDPEFAAHCVPQMDAGADFATCSIRTVAQDPESGEYMVRGQRKWPFPSTMLTLADFPKAFTHLHGFLRTIWANVFRLAIIRDHHLQHPDMIIAGDTIFVYNYLRHVNKIYITDQLLHTYRAHFTSQSFRYDPKRHTSLQMMKQVQLETLKLLRAATAPNMDFVHFGCLNDYFDALDVDIKAILAGQPTKESISQLMADPLLVDGWATIARMYTTRSFATPQQVMERVLTFKQRLYQHATSLYKNGYIADAYAIACFLAPGLDTFWDSSDLPHFLDRPDSPGATMLLVGEQSTLQMCERIGAASDAFTQGLLAYLNISQKQEFSAAGTFLLQHGSQASLKSKQFIARRHPILQDIPQAERLFAYPALLQHLWGTSRTALLQVLPETIAQLAATHPADALTCCLLGKITAAIDAQDNYYLFFCKAELELRLELGELEAFQQLMREMRDLLPDDPELDLLQAAYNNRNA